MSGGRRGALRALAASPFAAAWPLGAWAVDPPLNWPALTLVDGTPWRVPLAADGRPHAVVAVIWSTTCPFCLRHNARIEQLHRLAAGRPLAVVTAALEREPQVVSAYLSRYGYSFPVVREADRLRTLFTTRRVIPFTATVDRQGLVRERVPGEMLEDDVLGLLRLAA
jgi:thiol-disulfide isomerase/thioredoxin